MVENGKVVTWGPVMVVNVNEGLMMTRITDLRLYEEERVIFYMEPPLEIPLDSAWLAAVWET